MAEFRANFAIPAERADKVSKYIVGVKQAPKVISQHPAAGTPVIAGMTIEIQTVSFSDVPMFVLDDKVAVAVKNVPVAQIETIFDTDIRFKNAVNTGTIPDADRAFITEQFNRELVKAGYSGQLSTDEVAVVIQSFNSFGFEL